MLFVAGFGAACCASAAVLKVGSGSDARGRRQRGGFKQRSTIHGRSTAVCRPGASHEAAPYSAAHYVVFDCGASMPGGLRDEMRFTTACRARFDRPSGNPLSARIISPARRAQGRLVLAPAAGAAGFSPADALAGAPAAAWPPRPWAAAADLSDIRVQIGDHIGALMCVGDAGKRHERARTRRSDRSGTY